MGEERPGTGRAAGRRGADAHYDYRKVLVQIAVAFVVFSLGASSIYLVNDVRDVEADRQHPTKRFRPIAAGVVPEWLAYTMAVVLAVHPWRCPGGAIRTSLW